MNRPAVPLVKICGLSTPDSIEAAVLAGADRMGLVFFARSPRHVSIKHAVRLAAIARGALGIVALTVDADDLALQDIVEAVRPDWLQLHGSESPERVATIRRRFGIPLMKAVGVARSEDLANVERYRAVADAILLDAKPPRGSMLPGGNGAVFDWALLRGGIAPDMLSGGLSPDNVADAIRFTGAQAVDVSSGVESAPGVKDADKIHIFVRAAKGAVLA